MNILIIEDERPAASQLKRITERLRPGVTIIGPLESVKDSLAWFKKNPPPDLIFCDIQLADGLSFEIFEQLEVSSPVIFTTAYDQFAIRAFKLNSIDYLLKPVDPAELDHALKKLDKTAQPQLTPEILQGLLQATKDTGKTRFMVKIGDTIKSIPISETAYFSSSAKATCLHTTAGKTYIIDYSLNELEDMLNKTDFFRLNRQYITSIAAIKNVIIYSNSRYKITLTHCPDDSILVSRNKVDLFKAWMDGKSNCEF